MIIRRKYLVHGCPNSHFFMSETGVVTNTLTQGEKFTVGNLYEIDAPVWQLCQSRHDNPIANMGGILPKCIANPMDMYGMKQDILDVIKPIYGLGNVMFCVVTGMSSALIALVNACAAINVELVLLHYDVVHDCYQTQRVDNFYLEEKKEILRRVDNHDGLRAITR